MCYLRNVDLLQVLIYLDNYVCLTNREHLLYIHLAANEDRDGGSRVENILSDVSACFSSTFITLHSVFILAEPHRIYVHTHTCIRRCIQKFPD
jgi:hypothetical protein